MHGIVKWAGSKWRTMDKIKEFLPRGHSRLVDPFGGSLASVMKTDYKEYLVGDINGDLVSMYNLILEKKDEFIATSKVLFENRNNDVDYKSIRSMFNLSKDNEVRAMMFLYLNRHCFNGLCRYSKTGNFNVPFGKMKNPQVPEKEIELLIKKSESCELSIINKDFRDVMSMVNEGDVVYCDPPYLPLSKTANFSDYHTGGFGLKDHIDLASLSAACANRGATVVITNNDTVLSREIYKGGVIHSIMAPRNISSKSLTRVKTKEIVVVF
jgi:DNA adenine methylase